ncbi:MAG: potassium-transporting ATPase subunit KdpB [Actinomycetota bacterium]|nr:potassium-transporting ATPase subunit KdpB [Actinomycetota bacterium]MDP3631008.1 potassium-transporting ATPase subunit KdpB [Actinomycetota bacterium]
MTPEEQATNTETPAEARLARRQLVTGALLDAVRKLDPRVQLRNPVMFVVEVGSVIATVYFVLSLLGGAGRPLFLGQIAVWLWITVLFANFAEAMAEGRGKAQADTLRKMRTETNARVLRGNEIVEIPAAKLRRGDTVVVETGEIIPGDGDVIEGIASVDESAITGESAPVIRESGGDRSAVTGGTKVLSDRIVVRITSNPGETFIDRMIALVEGAARRKTPNEIALSILLSGLTIIFLLVVVTLEAFAAYSQTPVAVSVLIALLVCLIPTTIGGLLSAIGIAGMDRLVRHNVLAMSGRAVEAAGDVDTLLLDKTGTITFGNRQAAEFRPVSGVSEKDLADVAQLASLSDETPEGRSIVVLAKHFGFRDRDLGEDVTFVPFTAQTRMSGIDLHGDEIRKGAADSVTAWVRERGGTVPADLQVIVEGISGLGGTPLVVARNREVLGVIYLKDIVKGGIRERFEQLRAMGIRTVMITGDNPLTAAVIAREAGVDDFLAEATPEAKLELIRGEQADGRLVAMIGDGTNDAPALAQADVGVAMNTGTAAAKEAGNMIDLDSNPTKLIEIVEIGKQLLMTRGALTTFSIANDVAKYFAIIPALFIGTYPQLAALDIMRLHSSESAILSAVVFNALIIIALVPLALRGVKYRPLGAARLLRSNLLVYGLGGLVAPFVGIKLVDLALTALRLV